MSEDYVPPVPQSLRPHFMPVPGTRNGKTGEPCYAGVLLSGEGIVWTCEDAHLRMGEAMSCAAGEKDRRLREAGITHYSRSWDQPAPQPGDEVGILRPGQPDPDLHRAAEEAGWAATAAGLEDELRRRLPQRKWSLLPPGPSVIAHDPAALMQSAEEAGGGWEGVLSVPYEAGSRSATVAIWRCGDTHKRKEEALGHAAAEQRRRLVRAVPDAPEQPLAIASVREAEPEVHGVAGIGLHPVSQCSLESCGRPGPLSLLPLDAHGRVLAAKAVQLRQAADTLEATARAAHTAGAAPQPELVAAIRPGRESAYKLAVAGPYVAVCHDGCTLDGENGCIGVGHLAELTAWVALHERRHAGEVAPGA